jgi:hypothetical protein
MEGTRAGGDQPLRDLPWAGGKKSSGEPPVLAGMKRGGIRRAFWLGSLARSSQLRDSAGLQELCAPDFPPYLRGLILHGTDERQFYGSMLS